MSAALLGCTLAATTRVEAAIVQLDIAALGIGGANAGVAAGTSVLLSDLPVPGATLRLANQWQGNYAQYTGFIGGGSSFQFASAGGYANLRDFSAFGVIDATAGWVSSAYASAFTDIGYSGAIRANLGPGSHIGFRFTIDGGSNWNYGWFEVTWDSSTLTFEILAGAYESTRNMAITTPGAVPLPGAAGLAACGLLAAGRRRRR